jgi:hypothetical protein
MKKTNYIYDHQQKRKFYQNIIMEKGNTQKYDNFSSSDNRNYQHNFFKINSNIDDRANTDFSVGNIKDKRVNFLSSGGVNSGLATNDNSVPKSTLGTIKKSPESLKKIFRKKKSVNYCNLVNTNNLKNNLKNSKKASKEKSIKSKSRSKSPYNKIGIIDEEEININIPQPYPQNVSQI